MNGPHTLLDLSRFPKAQQLFKHVLSGKYQVVFYGGSVRSGKSFNALGCLVMLHLMYPGARSIICRSTWMQLKKATLPTAKKVFPPQFFELVNSSQYVWKTKNGGECFFWGENYKQDKELTRWDGIEFNFAVLDQIDGMTSDGFDKVLERLGSYFIPGVPIDQQPPPTAIATLNPCRGWLKNTVYKPWTKGELPDRWIYIPAKITDNPHVPQSYIDSLSILKTRNPREYKRRMEGDWDYSNDPADLIGSDELQNLFTNDFITGEGEPCYISGDVARFGRDSSVILVWRGLKVIAYEEIKGKKRLTYFKDRVLHYSRLYQVPRSRIVIDEDGMGGGPVDDLKCVGFVNNRAAIGKDYNVHGKAVAAKELYANLKTQCGYKLAEMINANRLYFPINDPEFRDGIEEELEALKEKSPGTDGRKRIIPKDEMKELLKRSPDKLDSMIMRMYFEIKPKPNIST